MKELFIIWITIQLMIMGYWDMEDRKNIYKGEFDCKQITMKHEPKEWLGAVFPLLTIPTKITLVELEMCGRSK